jgi:hypothetical protein
MLQATDMGEVGLLIGQLAPVVQRDRPVHATTLGSAWPLDY